MSRGFIIQLRDDFPGVLRKHTVTPRDPIACQSIANEVSSLLDKKAIAPTIDAPHLCLSPVFTVPKRSGGMRVILNLKQINKFIPDYHFRMETLSMILPQLKAGDWAVSIDLQDAYLHVPIHPESQYLLGFSFRDEYFQFKVLPFGLKPSPRVFTRLVATVVAHLRREGVRIFYYLDDWLIVAESRDLLLQHRDRSLELAQSLGFLINWKKSALTPSRTPVYLGATLDIPRRLASPAPHRVAALRDRGAHLISAR